MYILTDEQRYLSQLCEMLHKMLHIDIELYDNNFQRLISFYSTTYPEGIGIFFQDYIPEMQQNLKQLHSTGIFIHSIKPLNLACIDIKITSLNKPTLFVSAGPFLTQAYSEGLIFQILRQNQLSLSKKKSFEAFFCGLPYLSEQMQPISWLICHLLTARPDIYLLKTVYEDKSGSPLPPANSQVAADVQVERSNIIRNYSVEKKLRAAVSCGNIEAAQNILSEAANEYFLYRTPDNPLRAQKNLMFSTNTLLRIAAVDGGADIMKLHDTSDAFTIEIEKASNALEIAQLEEKMVKAYCTLVIESQTSQYSTIVANAILYLYANFELPLTLRAVARHVNYSEGHLSRTFKQETGMTLTQYLNKIRIQEAASLLRATDFAITEIAVMVGFSSYSKFSVEFKNQMKISAREFRSGCKKDAFD